MVKLATQACRVLLLLSLLTGLMYPMLTTGLAQLFFPWRANGSLLSVHGQTIGSQWIGQEFTAEEYVWGRPSATSVFPYNAVASGGSNWGPLNPDYLALVRDRIARLHFEHLPIPVELVTASGSGLDPDISPLAAQYQVDRIAKARHLSPAVVRRLIDTYTHRRVLSLLGEPRVNVLQLNLALDAVKQE